MTAGERKVIVAQTKTKAKSKTKTRRSGSGSNGSGAKATRAKAKSHAKASEQAKANGRSVSNGVGDSVKRGAKGVGPIARKAKVPLLASGAALVGVAGAIAATHSSKRHKVMGISMPKANGAKPDAKKISNAVVDIAKRADEFGQGVSRVASSVRGVGETANEVAKKV